VPRVIITDKLKSYGAAKREMLPSVVCRGLNLRAIPNAFCLRMAPLPNTSAHDGLYCLRRSTAER
jgi:hypothetical protein